MITYEQPLNEKIRLFLRLELLVNRFKYHVEQADQADTLAALQLLLELYNLTARMDLKSDVIKETDRIAQVIRRSMEVEPIADTSMDYIALIDELQQHVNRLYQLRGSLGQHLYANAFFSQLRQRTSLAGGLNGFDIPVLNFWLNQPEQARAADLQQWGEPFVWAAETVSAMLVLIRSDCEASEQVAKAGFFQAPLSAAKVYQMIQVELTESQAIYPEISAGKQRFSLRFVEADDLAERGKQVAENVSFCLKLCSF